MTQKLLKNLLFFFIVTLAVPISYVIGIGSNPNYASNEPAIDFDIVTRKVLPIETALKATPEIINQSSPVNISAIENPFQNGKVYNLVPQNQEPRQPSSKKTYIPQAAPQPAPSQLLHNRILVLQKLTFLCLMKNFWIIMMIH